MAVTLDVPPAVLQMAADDWDEVADRLDGAWRRLVRTGTSGLSPEVGAALESFADTWVAELKTMATGAEGNSDAFVQIDGTFQIVDRDQAEHLRSLLSWDYHDATIGSAR